MRGISILYLMIVMTIICYFGISFCISDILFIRSSLTIDPTDIFLLNFLLQLMILLLRTKLRYSIFSTDYFRGCVGDCYYKNCSTQAKVQDFESNQPVILSMTGWSCYEECKYGCQWKTIDFLLSPQVSLSAKDIPQFHGKVCHDMWYSRQPS